MAPSNIIRMKILQDDSFPESSDEDMAPFSTMKQVMIVINLKLILKKILMIFKHLTRRTKTGGHLQLKIRLEVSHRDHLDDNYRCFKQMMLHRFTYYLIFTFCCSIYQKQ